MNWKSISKYRVELMGFFALWIMFYHNEIRYGGANPLWVISKQGNVGVDAFLFLSGVGLYFSYNKQPQALSFYRRRLVRLLVPYLFLAIPFYWCRVVIEDVGVVEFFSYVSQYAFIRNGSITTWFIPCIAGCSIIFPAIYYAQNESVIVATKRLHRNTVTLIMIVVWFAVLLFIQNRFQSLYSNTEIALTRLIVFIIGCHCGKYVMEEKELPHSISLAGFTFIVVYTFYFRKMVTLPGFWIRMSYVPLALSWIFFICGVLSFLEGRFNIACFRVLRFAGVRSLEIYLTHIMIRWLYSNTIGMPYIENTGSVDYIIVMAVALLVSGVIQPVFAKIETFLLKE